MGGIYVMCTFLSVVLETGFDKMWLQLENYIRYMSIYLMPFSSMDLETAPNVNSLAVISSLLP